MFASFSHKLRVITIFSFTSDTEEVVQVSISLFECLNKENNYIISDTKDLREETNDLISDLNDDISTLEKKVGSLNVEIDNINQNQHGDRLFVSTD